jgi:hypothetical protein
VIDDVTLGERIAAAFHEVADVVDSEDLPSPPRPLSAARSPRRTVLLVGALAAAISALAFGFVSWNGQSRVYVGSSGSLPVFALGTAPAGFRGPLGATRSSPSAVAPAVPDSRGNGAAQASDGQSSISHRPAISGAALVSQVEGWLTCRLAVLISGAHNCLKIEGITTLEYADRTGHVFSIHTILRPQSTIDAFLQQERTGLHGQAVTVRGRAGLVANRDLPSGLSRSLVWPERDGVAGELDWSGPSPAPSNDELIRIANAVKEAGIGRSDDLPTVIAVFAPTAGDVGPTYVVAGLVLQKNLCVWFLNDLALRPPYCDATTPIDSLRSFPPVFLLGASHARGASSQLVVGIVDQAATRLAVKSHGSTADIAPVGQEVGLPVSFVVGEVPTGAAQAEISAYAGDRLLGAVETAS